MTGTTALSVNQTLLTCSLNLLQCLAEQGCVISGPVTAEVIVLFFFCFLRYVGSQDVEFKLRTRSISF